MELGPADDGAAVTARVGETITLRLPENPTSGFLWRSELDADRSIHLSVDRFHGPNEPRGAPGQHHFEFLAARPGITVLRLVKERSWEGKQTDEFAVTVNVRQPDAADKPADLSSDMCPEVDDPSPRVLGLRRAADMFSGLLSFFSAG
jgi:inhibitor of cysteine peptidase